MRRRIKRGHHIGIICLAMVMSMSAVGVGFAAWQDGVEVKGVVATGSIEPVFVYCTVEGESAAPSRAEAFVHGGGKKISIRVQDAFPGYYAHFRYRVANLGTVPVQYETYFSCSEPGVEVVLGAPAGVIDGRGDSREGDMWLQVGSVLEDHNYSFEVGLNFRQWNAVE